MKAIEIKKGEIESAPQILGHWSLHTIFSPASKYSHKVTILGSHDNIDYGLISTGSKHYDFVCRDSYMCHVFNADDFLGVQYYKLQLDVPAREDLTFHVHTKDT